MNYYKIILLILILYFVLNNTSENLGLLMKGSRLNCKIFNTKKKCVLKGKCWFPWSSTCKNCSNHVKKWCNCIHDGKCWKNGKC